MASETLSLDELIAAIDRETETIADPTAPEPVQPTPPVVVRKPGTRQYIKFYLNNIVLCLPLASALEIGRQPAITPLPNLPRWVLGVSNIRGEIVSMVDIKAFFELSSTAIQGAPRFIIVHHQNIKVGFLVDRIAGIISLDQIDAVIQANPYQGDDDEAKKKMSRLVKFINGVIANNDELINVMDVTGLLMSPQMNAFQTE